MCSIVNNQNSALALTAFQSHINSFNLGSVSGGTVNGALFDLLFERIIVGHALITNNCEIQVVITGGDRSLHTLNRFFKLLESVVLSQGGTPSVIIQPTNSRYSILIRLLLRRGYIIVNSHENNFLSAIRHAVNLISIDLPVEFILSDANT